MPNDSLCLTMASETSNTRTLAALQPEPGHRLRSIEEKSIWSPCYICFGGGKAQSFSSLVVFQLLMHEIWMWENEMADSDHTAIESAPDPKTRDDIPERVPDESELLPCHYFDFFYGSFHGGVVATLLGRLRLRVEDATERFYKIHQAFSRRKEMLAHIPQLRRIMRIHSYEQSIEDAVYSNAERHLLNPSDPSCTDQLFRDSISTITMPPFMPHHARPAQTCVVASITIDGGVHEKSHAIRTFRPGDEHPDERAVNRLNLTICQVLRAVMGAPVIWIDLEDAPISSVAVTRCYPGGIADHDYERIYSAFPGRRVQTLPVAGPSAYIKKSTIGAAGWFVDIGWNGIVEDPRLAQRGTSFRCLQKVLLPAIRNLRTCHMKTDRPEPQQHDDQHTRELYVQLRLYPDINDRSRRGESVTINAPNFHGIYENTVKAVNNNTAFKDNLRQIAKELVRRRRARQAMGGHRWEVFVGNTAIPGDGNEDGRS